MQNPMNLFTDHPKSVNETYLEHMHMSGSFGVWLFLATLCAFCHALLPFMFEKTASNIIKKLHTRMVSNRVIQPVKESRSLSSDGASFYHI